MTASSTAVLSQFLPCNTGGVHTLQCQRFLANPMHLIAEDILTFWFGTTDLSTVMERRQVWFRSTPRVRRHTA